MTKVLFCACSHPYQDARYGKQMRVHNPKTDKNGTKWRCTVCEKEKP